MKTKPISQLFVALFILSIAAFLVVTFQFSSAREPEPTKPAEQTLLAKAASTPEVDVRALEPISIILPKSFDSITTGSDLFQSLRGKHFDSVIFIGENNATKSGNAAIFARDIETPSGRIVYDTGLAQVIARSSNTELPFESRTQLHDAVKKQIGELRRVLGEFKAVIILANFENAAQADQLADALANAVFGNNILIAGRADVDVNMNQLRALPANARVLTFDEQLQRFINKKPSAQQENAALPASQRIANTLFQVARTLGYNRILLSQSPSDTRSSAPICVLAYEPLKLTDVEKKSLLAIARRSLEEYVRTGKMAKPQTTDDALLKREAGFVTLTENGELRGCIGTIFPHAPIAEVVNENAVRAAVSDSRFPRVTARELAAIKVEVTVFTSRMKRVKAIEEIQIGRDGLYIRKGYNAGIFLPQVPVEFGWDRMQYLRQICGKAGLPSDAWRDARLYRYTGIYFGE